MTGLALQFDIIGILLISTSVALTFLALRWLAGLLIGGPLEPLGKAMFNVFPS